MDTLYGPPRRETPPPRKASDDGSSGGQVLDDELNVLPLSRKHVARFAGPAPDVDESGGPAAKERAEIAALAETLSDAPPAGELVALARTLDQARAVLAFIDALAARRARSVTTLTAPRGRGKSAALGLCLAAAVATGYASVFVTAPAVDNVRGPARGY